MNAWLEQQMTQGFKVYSEALALKLHFTSDYDYNQYHGKTNATLQRYIEKGPEFTGKINKLANRLKTLSINPREFVFASYRTKVVPVQFMNAIDCFSAHAIWEERYGSLTKWVATGEGIMRALVANGVTPSKMPVNAFLDEVLTRVVAGTIDREFLLYVNTRLNGYVFDTYFQSELDFVKADVRDRLNKLFHFYY